MAFCDSGTAARAMIPTVAVLSQVNKSYTRAGSCSSTRATARESPYAAIPAETVSVKRSLCAWIFREVPPNQKREQTDGEAATDDVDAVKDFRASRTWQGLAQSEDLLVLRALSILLFYPKRS